MEILNGCVKKVMGRGKVKAVDMGCNRSYYNNRWILRGLIILCSLGIAGCGTLKSSLKTGAATVATVGVASALTSSAIVPAVVGGTTAAVASALVAEPSVKGEPISVTADTVVQHAPDNFFTLLGKLIKMGGIATILIVLVPMIFSWLLPGPIQFKGRKKK